MKLNLQQKQSLKLAPAMVQFMELVQMSAQELDDYIMQEALDNPLLDLDQLNRRGQNADAYERARWLRSQLRPVFDASSDSDDPPTPEPMEDWRDDLQNHLLLQLAAAKVSPLQRRMGRYLIGCVDERGYLSEDPSQVAALFQTDTEEAEACFAMLRSFSPPGVCACDLRHCLLSQLPPEDRLAAAIVEQHLDDLAQGHYAQIARALSAGTAEVRKACDRIRALSPRPASGFSGKEKVQYLVPDLLVTEQDGELEVSLFRSYAPDLRINTAYLDLYQDTEDEQVRSYLNERMRAAQQLMSCISQRESSILKCAEAIVELQRDFFLRHDAALRPLTLEDIAARMDVSVSTVSRTVKEKTLQCSRGVLPLRYFFSRSISPARGADASSDDVRQRLQQLIDGEDKSAPLSDQQLCSRLESIGLHISRRTVAKYREQLGIPGTYVRRNSG